MRYVNTVFHSCLILNYKVCFYPALCERSYLVALVPNYLRFNMDVIIYPQAFTSTVLKFNST